MKSNSEPAGPRNRPSGAFDYLSRPEGELTPEEECALGQELSAAYHMDESAATSAVVRHIAKNHGAPSLFGVENGLAEGLNRDPFEA